MFSAFQTFGRLGAGARAVAAAWSPSALWPTGTEPGMWISPRTLDASFNDYTGTTPVAPPGSVADSANPVGLALDIRAGATTVSDPGHHMLQSTSPARPLESARVNLLTYTEDLTAAVWTKINGGTGSAPVVTPGYPDPLGGTTAFRVQCNIGAGTSGGDYSALRQGGTPTIAGCRSIYVKSNTGSDQNFQLANTAISNSPFVTATPVFTRVSVNTNQYSVFDIGNSGDNAGATRDLDIIVWHPQLEISLTASAYQSVPTDGSTYTSTGITPFQLYDGVDDGMATASFAAGTLINGMDCMIPVRRYRSFINEVGGLYQTDQTKYFGVFGDGSNNSAPTYGGCGSPSIFVDGASVANTRGALFDALGVGEFHILEYRDLDLSSWVDAAWGGYPNYRFNGARGDIMLFESTASTADKDAARQYLADKYGVTLA